MPTIRGWNTGSKRYAGLIQEGDSQRAVFTGLEAVADRLDAAGAALSAGAVSLPCFSQ